MTDPRLEDHAIGVELQLTELVEKRERALIQGRTERAAELTPEIESLQAELAATAERIAGEHFERPDIAEGDLVDDHVEDEHATPPGEAGAVP